MSNQASQGREAAAAESVPARDTLERFVTDLLAVHPGESGCALLEDGRAALFARLALAGLAGQTLDVQYYLWHDDATGRLLARSLLDAADRGVRVRLLIDDIHLAGRDTGLAILDSHRNIDIRVFNPFHVRDWPSWRRLVEIFRDGRRLNRRMHNKVFMADGQLAIVGGRNIGDEYFAASEQSNFRDMDLLALGPVINEVSASFEQFWVSEHAVPVRSLTSFRPTRRFVRRWLRRLRRFRLKKASLQQFFNLTPQDLQKHLERLPNRLHWGPARALYDLPEKITDDEPPRVAQAMLYLLEGIERELLLESAYFVPDESSLSVLRSLRERGVAVTVLTNSLASNDVIAAHAGYAPHRQTLLEMGIELYESRSRAARGEPTAVGTRVGSRASLHSKAAVFDRKAVYVGTLNFDPRSLYLNTEIGLIVESPGLAAQVAATIGQAFTGTTSFRLMLTGEGRRQRLSWRAEGVSSVERFASEPEAGYVRRCLAWLYERLPIHHWL